MPQDSPLSCCKFGSADRSKPVPHPHSIAPSWRPVPLTSTNHLGVLTPFDRSLRRAHTPPPLHDTSSRPSQAPFPAVALSCGWQMRTHRNTPYRSHHFSARRAPTPAERFRDDAGTKVKICRGRATRLFLSVDAGDVGLGRFRQVWGGGFWRSDFWRIRPSPG